MSHDPQGAPALAPHPSNTDDLFNEGTPVGRLNAEPLPVPGDEPPRTALGRWLLRGDDAGHSHAHPTKPWFQVLWLTGVDYFSTLGYQPGLALLAAGALSPVATAILVLVTLFGALPVYRQVAERSYIGQGSIAMLERLLTGWKAKALVLGLLGFASTDFVITMTLSAADAAKHICENPYFESVIGHHELTVTLVLLALLAAIFLKGFSEAIGLAIAVGVPYILLNVVVSVRAFIEIAHHPEALPNWNAALHAKGDWTMLLLLAGLTFPKLALGLSGFETGVSVMPNVTGSPGDTHKGPPVGRIRATQKLLTAAALVMSVMLLVTSFISTVLIPEEAWADGGKASGRALAYLAHELFGPVGGTIYDVSTILILWFAGASAMAGLLNIIPRYLPRFGMAPKWISFPRPLVLVLFGVDVLVTIIFQADVEAQGGAYATGVLVLMLSAAVAVSLSLWTEAEGRASLRAKSLYFWAISAVFAFTLVDNVIERPDGVIIATVFTLAIVALSAVSRWRRATEFRVERLTFADAESAVLWHRIIGRKVNLVPIKHFSERALEGKGSELRRYYNVNGPLAFLHVNLRDDRSEFNVEHRVTVRRFGADYRITVNGAVAIANVIAYVSELIDPTSIFLGLTQESPMEQALKYVFWGEGETGILVYQILIRYWEWTPGEDVKPLIFLVSE